jgi:hypothetical protein
MTARMFLTGNLKSELFDLAADPRERNNLAGDRRLRRPLTELLAQHLAENATARPSTEPDETMDEAEREKIEKELRDLGYM